MKWKPDFQVRVLLLSFLCLACFHSKPVISTTTTAETPRSESTTVVAGILDSGTWKYPKLCYVKKSKVNELITRMNQTVQILNRKDAYLKCNEKIEAAVVDADNMKMCDDDRILNIQKDLSEVAAGLFQLAIRLSEPSEEEVDSLDRKKFQLVYDLKALRVFYGPSPCNENAIALFPFQPLVEYVEWNLDQVFVLFQTTRPTRPALPTTTFTSSFPPTTPKPSEEDMLNSHASFLELTEMAQSNPSAMSRALLRIMSQRYNEKASTFEKLLNFTESLPTTENQIFGVSAIHDEMYRYNRNPEPEKLMKMAKTVKALNATVENSFGVSSSARLKLADLVHNLSPLVLIGEKAECRVNNVAYQLQLWTADVDSPYSAYLATDSNYRFQVYPKVKNGRLVFRINWNAWSRHGPFYISDSNSNTHSSTMKYRTQPSERFVLWHWEGTLPRDAELDWKLVPIEGKANQFKILSDKFEDFMFAHQSATGRNSMRRVLLGRKSYSGHAHIPEADNWTLDCRPGIFKIPAS